MSNSWFSASNTDRMVVISVAAIAALVAIIGSALAWVTFTDPFGNQVSFTGTASTDGTGKATLILAVIALVVLGALCLKSMRKHIRPISSFVTLLGTATTGIAIYKLVYYER